MGLIQDEIQNTADVLAMKGRPHEKIAQRLIEAGLQIMWGEGEGLNENSRIVPLNSKGSFVVVTRHEMPLKADFRPVEPVSAASAPDEAPEPVVNAVAAIRAILADDDTNSGTPDERGLALEQIDQLLDRVMLVTDADIPAYLHTSAMGARRHGQVDMARTLDAVAEQIERGLHERPVNIEAALREFYLDTFNRNVKAGWWSDLSNDEPKKRSVGELFMLFVTEIAEAYDAYLDNAADDKLPQFPGLGVELGDLQIRLADFCGALMSGKIVEDSNTGNPGDKMFREVCAIARNYEAIRKTPEAIGDPEVGDFLEPQDVPAMVIAKIAFNATRPDHKKENRKAEGGKRT